jgi:hypothetical protein
MYAVGATTVAYFLSIINLPLSRNNTDVRAKRIGRASIYEIVGRQWWRPQHPNRKWPDSRLSAMDFTKKADQF